MKDKMTRRGFIGAAAAATAFTIVPRHVLGGPNETPPSEMLRVAGIGCGGQAMHDLGQVDRHAKIVALCDVDDERAANAYLRWPDAPRYKDFRQLLEKEQNNIDAVVVATADHVHAVASLAAMDLGKHVYVEKPMAHNIAEVRKLVAAAARTGVVTQMGNQGHSLSTVRQMKIWVEAGAIGAVREVHCWTNRPSWPQGIDRPTDSPPVPATLDWNLWLGPALERPYNPAYCPRNWRGWWDFGTGALGDMGCHILDGAYFSLSLGAPSRISAESSGVNNETAPKSSFITFEFPARGDMPPVTLKWYDGGNMPDRPESLPEDDRFGDADGGQLLIGEKGIIIAGTYSNGAKLYTNEPYDDPKVDIEIIRGHQKNWVEACKGEAKASSPFEYAGGLTELVHLGNIALRAGQPIEWDAANMKFPNTPDADQYVGREYREGWAV
jgi:predicted dehydrogenase